MNDLTEPVRRGGRPSKEQAQQLGEHILDVATELFLAQGYGTTSIEAVAQQARVAKRTFYHRFADKAALFAAVVHRIVERLQPPEMARLYEGGSCEEVLLRLAKLMLRAALTPNALALNRLLLAETARFPELAAVVAREGAAVEAAKRIAQMLEIETSAGRLAVEKPAFAAQHFLQMVIGQPQRRAHGLGQPMTDGELDRWAEDTVDLFLNGCRGRQR
ncbi:MAG TPA: TetR/AcrR family transcriptional regulator [Aliidongia sp.]|nr:TetR/AcrR family transcriptional regulator [Aliidongia sp.]